MSDRSPTEIGKYHIQELIGEGAMGVVYRAKDSVLGRTVAIKVMNASIARQEDLRQRFLREAQAAGSLQHPNVVTIYDLGEIDGHLFIAMEYVDGTDLERLMELSEPLKLQSKLDIVVDVLTGLAYAHKRGIVHRDIKPANIRVGDDGRAKIMDFGVAHLASSSMTRTGLVVGTPSYMAPEQVMGGKALPETDIFAVGAMLYQVLTGEKPFEAPTLQGLFYKIVTDMPKSVTDHMPGLPPALDRITAKALAKDPAERFHNALAMANELTKVRSQLSGAPYPATLSLETAAVTNPEDYLDDAPPSSPATAAISAARSSSAKASIAPAASASAQQAETPASTGTIGNRAAGIPPLAWMAAGALGVIAVAWIIFGRSSRAEPGLPVTPAAAVAPIDTTKPQTASQSDSVKSAVKSSQPATLATAPSETTRAETAEAAAPTRFKPPAVRVAQRPSPVERPRQSFLDRMKKRVEATRTAPPPVTRAQVTPRTSIQNPVVTGSPTVATPGVVVSAPPRQAIAPRTTLELPTRPVVTESTAASLPSRPEPRNEPKPEPKPESAASEIASVVAAYARAIESRDVSAVRRAYPGLTGDQARGFEQFFEATRSINVTFRVVGLDTNGNSADARLVGSYEYVTTGAKTERQPVSFAATLRNDGSSWRLVSVR